MSSHSVDRDQIIDDNLDGLIGWALQDAVSGTEPSPQVWERIQQRVVDGVEALAPDPPQRHKTFPRRKETSLILWGATSRYARVRIGLICVAVSMACYCGRFTYRSTTSATLRLSVRT